MRRYWLNVHHPVEKELKRDAWNDVYLKKRHESTYRKQIKGGDIAVIYEIYWKAGDTVQVDNKKIPLEEGRKGITAIVRITGEFVEEHYEFDDDPYIGHFVTAPVQVSRSSISLQKLREAWRGKFDKEFVPRINGGLRELREEEWQVISKLVGLK